jgi:hypothetical protein
VPSTRSERLYLQDIVDAADEIAKLLTLSPEELAAMRLEVLQAALLH